MATSVKKKSSAFPAWLILLGIIIIHIFLCVLNYLFISEDAFISFIYARNLAQGNGLVFNTGEYVEGYSNFLWTILLSGFIGIGVNVIFISKGLGIFFGILCLIILFHLSRLIGREEGIPNYAAILLLAINPFFIFWTQAGLENSLFSFLLLAGVLSAFVKEEKGYSLGLSPICFALACLTRPEAPILTIPFFAYKIFRAFKAQQGLKREFFQLSIFLTILILYHIWRFYYFGFHLFPNSYYAKTTPFLSPEKLWEIKRGIAYCINFLNDSRGWVLFMPLIFLFFIEGRKGDKELLAICGIIVLSYLFFIIYVGGDIWHYYRFFVNILPFIFFLVQEGLRTLGEYLRSKFRACPFLGLGLSSIFFTIILFTNLLFLSTSSMNSVLFYYRMPQNVHHLTGNMTLDNYKMFLKDRFFFPFKLKNWLDSSTPQITTFIAHWIQRNSNKNLVIATDQITQIPYYTRFRTIDLFGLTDPIISHLKEKPTLGGGLAAYILSQKPDYIILWLCDDNQVWPWHLQVFNDARFQENYHLQKVFVGKIYLNNKGYLTSHRMVLFERNSMPLKGNRVDFQDAVSEFINKNKDDILEYQWTW